jgi:hypothetical protein
LRLIRCAAFLLDLPFSLYIIMLGHIVKRGVAHLQAMSPEYMAKLHHESELYQNTWRDMEVSRQEVLPVLITGVIVFLILASVSPLYTTTPRC